MRGFAIRAIIEHVIHRFAEAALRLPIRRSLARHRRRVALPPFDLRITPIRSKSRPLEKRIDLAHRRERFDPRHRTRFAGPPHECRRHARAAIGRMQHDSGQHPELLV